MIDVKDLVPFMKLVNQDSLVGWSCCLSTICGFLDDADSIEDVKSAVEELRKAIIAAMNEDTKSFHSIGVVVAEKLVDKH